MDPRLSNGPILFVPAPSQDVAALMAACDLYNASRRRGLLRALWSALTGRPRCLRLLQAAEAYPAHGQGLGRAHVPIARIVGSEGRCQDFDDRFAPTQAHTRERWLSVALAWQRCQQLPPVRLIAVGDAYYVRDGHHRISVASAFGADTIEAEVEVWQPAAAPELAPAAAPLLSRA